MLPRRQPSQKVSGDYLPARATARSRSETRSNHCNKGAGPNKVMTPHLDMCFVAELSYVNEYDSVGPPERIKTGRGLIAGNAVAVRGGSGRKPRVKRTLSLIHISEPTRQ